MPRRGYRKGVNDAGIPVVQFVRTRLTAEEYAKLAAAAASRAVTKSKFVRAVLIGHMGSQRVALPNDRSREDRLLQHIARIGNNLNQLARQANAGLVAVSAVEIRQCLDALNRVAEKI